VERAAEEQREASLSEEQWQLERKESLRQRFRRHEVSDSVERKWVRERERLRKRREEMEEEERNGERERLRRRREESDEKERHKERGAKRVVKPL